ncbi:hypothetical protein FSP39_021969 [Pinctada imbricata]|uniref:C1q domain-containing protein n=1 Tax=Pinctada imbricata TaxID=66713 RepID=A0AA88YQ51_PINIB|nr:hypothetical protein FSP39_021969 [Pinctada imbricata]
MAYSDSDMYLNLLKNGMFVQRMYSNSGYADSSAFTTNLYLQAGDKIWIVNGGYGSDHLHPGNYNCFSVMLSKEKY